MTMQGDPILCSLYIDDTVANYGGIMNSLLIITIMCIEYGKVWGGANI